MEEFHSSDGLFVIDVKDGENNKFTEYAKNVINNEAFKYRGLSEESNVVDLALEIFDYVKFKTIRPTVDNSWLAEYWHLKAESGEYSSSPLEEHTDDDGGVVGKVNAILLYPKLKNPAHGGELVINEYTSRSCNDVVPIYKFNFQPENGYDYRFIIMRGDISHSIEPILGPGERECYVIQLPRIFCLRNDTFEE